MCSWLIPLVIFINTKNIINGNTNTSDVCGKPSLLTQLTVGLVALRVLAEPSLNKQSH
ncbi:hypothetical protein QWZ16_04720 [Vibrio ostreicida]|uniref:Uncharacterized protein n=1 Tax=Vibrio ostreicida TaxID=526588 RepID=A0ABT8BPE2_9VIBR|nr:hypothetical protein [Vibrio ostreicida]MDN3609026.1 hypothetical protein [Vibrio ostreicida]